MTEKIISTSAVLSRLAGQKLTNAATYQDVTNAINSYSRSLGRVISGYAEVDAAVAGLLRGNVFLAVQGERHHQGLPPVHALAVKSVTRPVAFPVPQTGPEADVEAEATRILEVLIELEDQTARMFAEASGESVAEDIATVLHLGHAAGVSKNRARDMRGVIAAIRGETYWTRPAPVIWHCMQCGVAVKSTVAFQACPCCQAGRAYATANN